MKRCCWNPSSVPLLAALSHWPGRPAVYVPLLWLFRFWSSGGGLFGCLFSPFTFFIGVPIRPPLVLIPLIGPRRYGDFDFKSVGI